MSHAAHPAVRVGHVHLRVADLDRSIAFYRDALGFRLVADGRPAGVDAAFLAAGDYHHHVALNTLESAGGRPAPPGHTGLHHVAFLYPDRDELVRTVRRVLDLGYAVDHTTDHGATVAVYLDDPDGNGVELYYDRRGRRGSTRTAGRSCAASASRYRSRDRAAGRTSWSAARPVGASAGGPCCARST
jgi:catechol 2,3-dioxygenase